MPDDGARAAEGTPGASRDASGVSGILQGLSLTAPPNPPPPPAKVGGGIVLVDITNQFIAACSTLEPGELVKDGYFALFESVGALEIMDPKMDSGCLPAEELEDDDYDVARPLLPEEVIGIIDQLLCLEMGWHQGYPLSQTLFTSIYLYAMLTPTPTTIADADFVRGRRPQDLAAAPAQAVLRAYCVALLKTCWHAIEWAKPEIFYEEEDFATNTYHLSLLEAISQEDVRQVLHAARETALGPGHGWTDEAALALDARLAFRESFLDAMERAELRTQAALLREPWTQMGDAVARIQTTHALGTAVPAAFSIKLQRQLASTMPPRPIVQPAFDEACRAWRRFCDDGAEAMGLVDYTDPQSLLGFVLTFQSRKQQQQQPLACIRTLMQGLLFADNIVLGALSVRQILDDDLALVVLPASLLLDRRNDDIEDPHDARFLIAQHMEDFRQRAFPAYLDVFRTLCQNRSRARRMLCHAIQEWDRVQIDAETVDQRLQVALERNGDDVGVENGNGSGSGPTTFALPLSSWAFLYKLRLMEWVVQLGFELEIYQADELAGMYWYLCYLAKRRVQHAERIRSFTQRSLQAWRANGQPGGPDAEAAFARSLAFLGTTLIDASVTWELADAMSCLYAVLHRSGRLPGPAPQGRPYGTAALRYELRMRPFATIGLPPLPPYDTFATEAAQPAHSASALLAYADAALGGAKKGCELLAKAPAQDVFAIGCAARWRARAQCVHKSAIFAGIAVATVRKALAADDRDGRALTLTVEVPKPDTCYHEWWIVPKIKA